MAAGRRSVKFEFGKGYEPGNRIFFVDFPKQEPPYGKEYVDEILFRFSFLVGSTIRIPNGRNKGPLVEAAILSMGGIVIQGIEQIDPSLEGFGTIPQELQPSHIPYVFNFRCRTQTQPSLKDTAEIRFRLSFLEEFLSEEHHVKFLGEGSEIEVIFADQPRPETGFGASFPSIS